MAVFPLVLLGVVRRPNVIVATSIGLYFAARQFDWNLSSFPDGRWYLNPFCWQILFVLGAWLALSSPKQIRAVHTVQEFAVLRAIRVAVPAPCHGGDDSQKNTAGRRLGPGYPARCLWSQRQGKPRPLTEYFTFSRWLFCSPTWCRETGPASDGRRCSRP